MRVGGVTKWLGIGKNPDFALRLSGAAAGAGIVPPQGLR